MIEKNSKMTFFKNSMLIVVSALLASTGLKSFLLPNNFVDGGITGISMIVSRISDLPLFIFLVTFNIPFLILGYKMLGRNFAVRSIIAVALLALSVAAINFPIITNDKLLAAIFGGVFLGAGIGLAIRGSAVLDGTEILALSIGQKSPFSVGDIILAFNVVIFSFAGFSFGIETALYSVLTYASASKTVDFLIHGLEEFYSILIITSKSDELRTALISDLKRSVSRFVGKTGLSDEPRDFLLCVVTRLEIIQLKNFIKSVDEDAFVIITHVSDIAGGVRRSKVIERMMGQR